MDYDEGRVFVSGEGAVKNTVNSLARDNFTNFLRTYVSETAFCYKEQLRNNCLLGNYSITVKLEDLSTYNPALLDLLNSNPSEILSLFSDAAKTVAKDLIPDFDQSIQIILDTDYVAIKGIDTIPLRGLLHKHISKLVAVTGIVVAASRKQAKATSIAIICRNCRAMKKLPIRPGFNAIQLPINCDAMQSDQRRQGAAAEKCPPNPYVILPDQCTFVDHQTLKLQEDPESIPTGEMPRTMRVSLDRALVGKAVPGARVTVLGIYTVAGTNPGKKSDGVVQSYMRVVGLKVEGAGRLTSKFTPEEENEMIRISRRPQLYKELTESIAPAIYGHTDIKKSILCQLFGGSRKYLPDGMKLRGDINILLLGDPGTAKSQMLKFVEKVAPVGVYTSGKGSSAAGLTASVAKEKGTKEFYLEGGAMVLADGGIVCIDEFDKMRLQDRVAIHEAMEQQTISIAKAGITTILNSRTSVLAAANPVFGRYDELKSASENIDFQSTILSRFDLIFLVKDQLNEVTDSKIATHIIKLHTQQQTSELDAPIPLLTLKRYIAYCRAKCVPRLSQEASEALKNHYVNIRSTVRSRNSEGKPGPIPITVRQLEAIIRLSEALAKMSLSSVATEEHVNEAIRLFNVSTLEAATSGVAVSESLSPQLLNEVHNAETLLKRRLPIGSQISVKFIVDDFVRQSISEIAIRRAIAVMEQRGELEYRAQRKKVYRKY